MKESDLVFRDYTHTKWGFPCRGLAVRALSAALPYLKIPPGYRAEVAVTVVGSARMRTLNRRWRKVDRPTDVLAFPLHMRPVKSYTSVALGDVFICPDVVRRKASDSGVAVRTHLKWALVHGFLHLAGYDHENSASSARRMASLESRILRKLDIRH